LKYTQKTFGLSWFEFVKLFRVCPNIIFASYRGWCDGVDTAGICGVWFGKDLPYDFQFYIDRLISYRHLHNKHQKVITYPSGLQYTHSQKKYEEGEIRYKDGITRSIRGFDINSTAECDARHPSVVEKFKRKECCGIEVGMPQHMARDSNDMKKYYCQHCWINCMKKSEDKLKWGFIMTKCSCWFCHDDPALKKQKFQLK
jgi:hypothetical protein